MESAASYPSKPLFVVFNSWFHGRVSFLLEPTELQKINLGHTVQHEIVCLKVHKRKNFDGSNLYF
jgi:hypothetical protein